MRDAPRPFGPRSDGELPRRCAHDAGGRDRQRQRPPAARPTCPAQHMRRPRAGSDAEDERRPRRWALGERGGPGAGAPGLRGQGGFRAGGAGRAGVEPGVGPRRARGDDLVCGRLGGAAGGIGGPHGRPGRRRRVRARAMMPIVRVNGRRLTGRGRLRRFGAVPCAGRRRVGRRVVVHHDGTDGSAGRQHAWRRRQGADREKTRQMPGPLAHDSSIPGRFLPAGPPDAVHTGV